MAKNPYPSETQDRFIVRLPEGMRDRIAEAASKFSRSMNSEVVARLEASFTSESISATVTALAHRVAELELQRLTLKLELANLAFDAKEAIIRLTEPEPPSNVEVLAWFDAFSKYDVDIHTLKEQHDERFAELLKAADELRRVANFHIGLKKAVKEQLGISKPEAP